MGKPELSSVDLRKESLTVGFEPVNKLSDEVKEKNLLNAFQSGILNRRKSCDVCDFETAITATSYGKYNCLLMLASLLGLLASMFATSTMSLILPSAGCDLNLTNVEKGTLNAVIYVGMITSAYFWGFLSDTLGRRKLLLYGYGCEFVCATVVGFAQDYTTLLTAKLFSGFISSGPYAILMTYLAESHASKYRASIIIWTGVFTSLATIGLPGLAWLIIPQTQLRVDLFNGAVTLPSWRIFLLVATIPAFSSAVVMYFFGESPKFLMSQGRREEALEVFRTIYSVNTGLPKDTYPVKCLVDEHASSTGESEKKAAKCPEEGEGEPVKRHGLANMLRVGWHQTYPLFLQPHLPYAVLVYSIQFGTLFGLNTIRLWTPQLFASMLDYEKLVAGGQNMTPTSVCDLLVGVPNTADVNSTAATEIHCSGSLVDEKVYLNSIIVGVVTAFGYLTSGYVIKFVGNKWLMVSTYLIGGICCMSMYWAISTNIMLIINCIYVTVVSVAGTAIISVVVDLFPTTLRTMAVSLTMMFGRVGAMTGNLVFPMLLDWNCSVPFFLLGSIVLATGVITLLLPKTKDKALE